jgi:hypothetical protein
MAIPFLHNINLSDNQLQNAKVHITSTAPTAAKGQIYLDSTASDNKLKYYDGTGWVVADATVSASFDTSDGVITFTTSSGETYTVDIDGRFMEDFIVAGDTGDNQTISDGNTLTIAGGTELASVGSDTDTITINHSDVTRTNTTGTALTPAYGGNFDVVTGVTSNARGHVTGVETTNITIPDAYDFIVAGDSGDNQTISDGDTLTIAGGTELESEGSATDTITINHSDVTRTNTTGTALTPDFGANFDVITGVTSNARGHITEVTTTNITIPENDSVDVTAITTDAAYYPTFVSAAGDVALNIDGSAADKLSYNPNSQTLTVKNLVVDGTQTILDETVQVVENSTILFEGTTADEFETKLTVVDPTADRTISLPDESGTVVLNAFKTVTADTGTDAVADSSTDTLTISGGNAISTVVDATGDSITINHDDTSSQASVDNSGNTVIQDITLDTYGHITGIASTTIVVPSDREFAVALDATESSVTKSTNTYTVTHSLNSRDVMVEVYHTSNYDTIFVDITRATVDTITVAFAAAVTDGDYRVLIKKIG